MDLDLASLPVCVELPMAVCLRPESAGPGQESTRVRSSLMLLPYPSLPPVGTEGHPPMGTGLRLALSSQARNSHVVEQYESAAVGGTCGPLKGIRVCVRIHSTCPPQLLITPPTRTLLGQGVVGGKS